MLRVNFLGDNTLPIDVANLLRVAVVEASYKRKLPIGKSSLD